MISQLGNKWVIFQTYSPKALDPFMRIFLVKSRSKFISIGIATIFFIHISTGYAHFRTLVCMYLARVFMLQNCYFCYKNIT